MILCPSDSPIIKSLLTHEYLPRSSRSYFSARPGQVSYRIAESRVTEWPNRPIAKARISPNLRIAKRIRSIRRLGDSINPD